MSAMPVSFTLDVSIVCTISCETVPAPYTGIDAVRSTVDPGATVADDAERVTASVAAAGSTGSTAAMQRVANATLPRTRPTRTCRN